MDRFIVIGLIVGMLISKSAATDYFNTARSEKIFGIYLTASAQLEEVHAHSNSFGFWPRTFEQITEYLDANKNRLLPVIKINHFLLDENTATYHHDVSGIIAAIEKSDFPTREILFLMDEPLWTLRTECQKRNKSAACNDISDRYAQTLTSLRRAGQALRQRFPEAGVMHIEAWAELALQKEKYPQERVIMLDDAEYLGFDCYGAYHRCGSPAYSYRHQLAYGEWVWDTMLALESDHPIGRKLLLVPGTFLAEGYFDDVGTLLEQIAFYAWILQQSDRIGGFGAFLWGDMIEEGVYFTGARHIDPVVYFLAFIAKLNGIQRFTLQQWACIAATASCKDTDVSSEVKSLHNESLSLPVLPSPPVSATTPDHPRAPEAAP